MRPQVWRELFTRAAAAAEVARVNKSRHIVSGIWLRYFFEDHQSRAKLGRSVRDQEILCQPRLPPQNMIFRALASFQFDFVLGGRGLAAELRAFDLVPLRRASPVTVHFFFRSLPRVEQIFARRDVFEFELAVDADRRLGIAKDVVRHRDLGRDQMNAQPRGQFGTLFGRNDAAVQTCRAFGDDHFHARQLFAGFYGDAIARSVDRLFRLARGRSRNGADIPAFVGQIGYDP